MTKTKPITAHEAADLIAQGKHADESAARVREQMLSENVYAIRYFNGFPFYVSQTCAKKGSGRALRDGVDWGYSSHAPGWEGLDKPLALSQYWQRRFCADMRRVGEKRYALVRTINGAAVRS